MSAWGSVCADLVISKGDEMLTVDESIVLLKNIEELEPFNDKTKSVRGWQIRTILLLLQLVKEDGENQAYYKDKLGWSFSAIGGHTKTLLENGFILLDDDERDPRHQSKRIYLVKGVREYLTEALNLKE